VPQFVNLQSPNGGQKLGETIAALIVYVNQILTVVHGSIPQAADTAGSTLRN